MGHTMLAQHCSCGIPLMRNKQMESYCVVCTVPASNPTTKPLSKNRNVKASSNVISTDNFIAINKSGMEKNAFKLRDCESFVSQEMTLTVECLATKLKHLRTLLDIAATAVEIKSICEAIEAIVGLLQSMQKSY